MIPILHVPHYACFVSSVDHVWRSGGHPNEVSTTGGGVRGRAQFDNSLTDFHTGSGMQWDNRSYSWIENCIGRPLTPLDYLR